MNEGRKLNGDGERAIDHEVGAGDAAGHRAREEDHAVGDFPRRAELAGRIDLQRRANRSGRFFSMFADAAVETVPGDTQLTRIPLPTSCTGSSLA
jgi:hypothetical protein